MNSSSFARAHEAWLQPPEYRPTPDDIEQDLKRVRDEVEQITVNFADEHCGEVEDSSDVEAITIAAKEMISALDEKTAEMIELEESLFSFPDPDAEHDDPQFWGDGE
jgi:hypothetical protein